VGGGRLTPSWLPIATRHRLIARAGDIGQWARAAAYIRPTLYYNQCSFAQANTGFALNMCETHCLLLSVAASRRTSPGEVARHPSAGDARGFAALFGIGFV